MSTFALLIFSSILILSATCTDIEEFDKFLTKYKKKFIPGTQLHYQKYLTFKVINISTFIVLCHNRIVISVFVTGARRQDPHMVPHVVVPPTNLFSFIFLFLIYFAWKIYGNTDKQVF